MSIYNRSTWWRVAQHKQTNNVEKRVHTKEGAELRLNIAETAEQRLKAGAVVRSVAALDGEIKRNDDGIAVLRGYGAVFNSTSEDLGGFYEIIAPGAFNEVLSDDVRAYFNHDMNLLLGRTASGTLEVGTDDNGLWYEVKLPDTSYARDLITLMERGDVKESSFGFTIKDDYWEERDNTTYRIITKVGRLFDVSPVSHPAYPAATSELKNAPAPVGEATVAPATPEAANAEEATDAEIYEYKLKLLKLENDEE